MTSPSMEVRTATRRLDNIVEKEEERGDDNNWLESTSFSSRTTYLTWQDLTVTTRSKTAKTVLISGLSGFAQRGRILAVMGPSGSGKSTFLDALAGRTPSGVERTGNLSLSGKKETISHKDVSYVTQEDLFMGTLTVRETVSYTAHLRLSSEMTKHEISEVVETIIKEMGLEDCADTKIGNWHLRGISGGEKKRLSICREIVADPLILLLDEPTTGLDSASAFFVTRVLRNIADDGRIIVCSIHQPSSDVFDFFDDLLLLCSGETVFFGESRMATKFFADAGFPCPSRRNPSDHFLRCISVDFDSVTTTLLCCQRNFIVVSSDTTKDMKTSETKVTLVENYKCSEFMCKVKNKILEIAATDHQVSALSKETNASWWKQLRILTNRSFVNMYRDTGYYWLRIAFYVLASISTGVLYFDIGDDYGYGGIIDRGKCVSFIYGFLICLSCGGMPFFVEELKLFYIERLNGHYEEAVFVLSNFISSLPFLAVVSLLSGTTIFYLVKLHSQLSHYCYFCINLFCCIAVIESCMMVVASIVPNALMAIGAGAAVVVLMMMASQIFRLLPDLPKFFWQYPMSYISFAKWAVQGQYKNVMTGLEFELAVPGEPRVKGEIILETTFAIPPDHSKWWDLSVLVFQLFLYKLLLILVLRYKKSTTPSLSGFMSKTWIRFCTMKLPFTA